MNIARDFQTRRTRLALIAAFALSLALRLWALHHYRFVGTDGGIDGVAMAWAGRSLFSGGGLTFRGEPETIHPPLYPILVGLAWKITGDLEFAGQIVSVVADSLIVFPVFFLARSMFGNGIAPLAALMAAVFPGFIFGATEIRSLSLYTLLLTSAAVFLYRGALNPSWLSGLLEGLTIGLCYLTRPEALILLPLALILPPFKGIGNRGNRKSIFASFVGVAAGLFLLSYPYWDFLHRHLGRWMLSNRAPYTFMAQMGDDWEGNSFRLYEHSDMALQIWEEGGGMGGFLWQRKGSILAGILKNFLSLADLGSHPQAQKLPLGRHVVNAAFAAAILLLIATGSRRIASGRWRFRDTFLLLLLGTAVSYQMFSVVEIRYYYYYLPIFLVLLAAGCEAWRRKCGSTCSAIRCDAFTSHAGPRQFLSGDRAEVPKKNSGCKQRLSHKIFSLLIRMRPKAALARSPAAAITGWAPAAAVLILMAGYSLYLIPRKTDRVPYEYKILGLWMQDNLPGVGKSLVMSRKMGVPFYADAGHVSIHPGSGREALEFARRRGADYLVIDEWAIPLTRPNLAFLLDETHAPPELEKLHSFIHHGRQIVLYRIAPPVPSR